MGRTPISAALATLALTIGVFVAVPRDSRSAITPPNDPSVDALYAPFDSLRTDITAYRWPLELSYAPTSVFGDYRSSHFHGGIDIGTRGQEGLDVHAMRDGYVSAARVSPFGYGRLLEVTHPDGFRTWYAHLRGYAPAIEAAVRARQLETGQYPVDIDFPPGAFPVHRGDVVAFTGSSGTGGPHLHFEIHDENGNPVNPLLSPDFAALSYDRSPPLIEEVGFLPLSAGTLVQGRTRPFYVRPQGSGREFRLRDTPHLTGLVGVTVRVKDLVGPRAFRNRVVALTLRIDSANVYEADILRFPLSETKQVAMYYDWAAADEGHPYHQKLFIEEGNRLPIYFRLPEGAGMLRTSDYAEGPHALEVVARDISGNESTLRTTVIFNHPPEIDVSEDPARSSGWERTIRITSPHPENVVRFLVSRATETGAVIERRTYASSRLRSGDDGWDLPVRSRKGGWTSVVAENRFGTASAPVWLPPVDRRRSNTSLRVETEFYRDFAVVTVTASLPLSERPSVVVKGSGGEANLSMRALSASRYEGSFALLEAYGPRLKVEARANVNGSPDVTGFDEFTVVPITRAGGGTIATPDSSFVMRFEPGSVFRTLFARLEVVDGEYRVSPGTDVLDRGADVEVRVPPELDGRRVGLFLRADGDHELIGSREPYGARVVSGHVQRFLGDLMLMEDERGPEISRLSILYSKGILRATFTLRDRPAEVRARSIRMSVDGTTLIGTYVPERRRVELAESIVLAPGEHELRISAEDRMGNRTEESRTFRTR